jgi:RES domain-containing protein
MPHVFRLVSLVALAGVVRLCAGVTLLVSEPYGTFGFFNPTGHAAIYLSGVCAETPTKLRACGPGESGVVISRYNRVAGYDWIAVPLMPYLYAVEQPEDVPETADAESVAQLRDAYRRARLTALAPDAPEGTAPKGDWIQLAGSAYDRTTYGFTLETSREDDERLIEYLNARPNRRRFHLLYRNCADFARSVINFYYPGALRRSFVADVGITTPKHLGKNLVQYSRQRELLLSQFVIPQVPGLRPSTKLRGVNESLIRSKKYVAPLLLVQPWAAASAGAAYLAAGRFNPQKHTQVLCAPASLPECTAATAEPTTASSRKDPEEGVPANPALDSLALDQSTLH